LDERNDLFYIFEMKIDGVEAEEEEEKEIKGMTFYITS